MEKPIHPVEETPTSFRVNGVEIPKLGTGQSYTQRHVEAAGGLNALLDLLGQTAPIPIPERFEFTETEWETLEKLMAEER